MRRAAPARVSGKGGEGVPGGGATGVWGSRRCRRRAFGATCLAKSVVGYSEYTWLRRPRHVRRVTDANARPWTAARAASSRAASPLAKSRAESASQWRSARHAQTGSEAGYRLPSSPYARYISIARDCAVAPPPEPMCSAWCGLSQRPAGTKTSNSNGQPTCPSTSSSIGVIAPLLAPA